MPTIDQFRQQLRSRLRSAELKGANVLEVNSGELHRALGGYPPEKGKHHQMPSCCKAMYGEQTDGDEVLSAPPKGEGASLTIRYAIPRKAKS